MRGNSLANRLAWQFAKLFPLMCGEVFMRISPRKGMRKVSVMFDIFLVKVEERLYTNVIEH